MPSSIGNFFIKTIVASPFHALLGNNLAVITLTGRRSGRLVSTPINVAWQGDAWTVTSLRSRTWWRNLRGGRTAHLRVDGRQVAVHGEVIESKNEAAAAFAAYFRQFPNTARFFDVKLNADGDPDPAGIERIAAERLLIRLCPVEARGITH
jgi:hypothetical protein